MILADWREIERNLGREELEMIKKEHSQSGSIQSRFNLGYALLRSESKQDVSQSLQIFRDIYAKDESFRREMSYYLALGYFKLGKYSYAKKEIEAFLVGGEDVPQANELLREIKGKIRNEAVVGAGIVGAGIAVAAILLGNLMKR